MVNMDDVNEISKRRAEGLFGSSELSNFEVGTTAGLREIHRYLFGGLYPFAGEIRTQDASKMGFVFVGSADLPGVLAKIDEMPEGSFGEIIAKYVAMNRAHPFLDGNGQSMRIWLDLILKSRLGKCVEWARVDKMAYMSAMMWSGSGSVGVEALLERALTEKIYNHEVFLEGIAQSYRFEE